MALFDPTEASYFCRGYVQPATSPIVSFKQWADGLAAGTVLREGSQDFTNFRYAALCELDRLLLLAASHYRRSIDLLLPSSAAWAHVTMYYGYFFAAKALLGMFGIWEAGRGRRFIEVSNGSPAAQEFVVSVVPKTKDGSHQKFWNQFYPHVATLVPWIDISLRHAITPSALGATWPIDRRNDINYDSYTSISLGGTLASSFRSTKFPNSLPGDTNTQFVLLQSLLLICCDFVRQFKLETNALDGLTSELTRRSRFHGLILDATVPNSLSAKIRRRAVA